VALAKTNVIPGTATQTSTTVTDIVFEDYTAGVTLNITPHISKGDMLRLEITLNRTDFKENSNVEIKETDTSIPPKTITKEFPSPPDRISTDLMTVSTVPDGTTIILGGLESVAQSKLVKKVPILGDLPLVGGLFRDIDDSDSVGKLYVFVRANIIRPGDQVEGLEDIRRVSGKYREEFEEMEEKFQSMQDWPGIDSPPMDPVKVLEDDDFDLWFRTVGRRGK
ncbi:MAG: type II secretion system protein GspD, partial [Planctomycetota bacterium]